MYRTRLGVSLLYVILIRAQRIVKHTANVLMPPHRVPMSFHLPTLRPLEDARLVEGSMVKQ